MGENIILGGFAALPVFLLLILLVFFRKLKRKRGSRSWRTLALGNLLIFLLLFSLVLLGGECYYRFVYDTTDAFGLSKTTARWFDRHFSTQRGWIPGFHRLLLDDRAGKATAHVRRRFIPRGARSRGRRETIRQSDSGQRALRRSACARPSWL